LPAVKLTEVTKFVFGRGSSPDLATFLRAPPPPSRLGKGDGRWWAQMVS